MRQLLAPVLVVMIATAAGAHDRTTSSSAWEIHGRRARVTVHVTELDLSRFPWAADAGRDRTLADYLVSHLRLLAGDAPCAVAAAPRALDAPAGRVVYEWALKIGRAHV